jgi:hypothetical protein
MKKNNIVLFLLLFFINTVVAQQDLEPISYYMDETKIPDPKVQYELPQTLIGEFIILTPYTNHKMSIYPSNKYIVSRGVPFHRYDEFYGHIIKKDNRWYFQELGINTIQGGAPPYFGSSTLTEIHITDNGFSYYYDKNILFSSMRKEDLPVPINLARDISIPERKAVQEYFSFNNSGTDSIDIRQVLESKSNEPFHYLQITNGIISIDFVRIMIFSGFIDTEEENDDFFKGIIRFTNGIPYFYIENPTAEIEIKKNGNIKITMLWSPFPVSAERKVYKDYQFPAMLTLIF